jgi:hypothetical protein
MCQQMAQHDAVWQTAVMASGRIIIGRRVGT